MSYKQVNKIEPYEELANAIVLQAIQDYATAKRRLKKDPENFEARYTVVSCEKFFKGAYIKTLTQVDIKWLLSKMQKEKRLNKFKFL